MDHTKGGLPRRGKGEKKEERHGEKTGGQRGVRVNSLVGALLIASQEEGRSITGKTSGIEEKSAGQGKTGSEKGKSTCGKRVRGR